MHGAKFVDPKRPIRLTLYSKKDINKRGAGRILESYANLDFVRLEFA